MPYVYHFNEDATANLDEGTTLPRLLGGKGALLSQLSQLRLPVPPGFTVATEACQYYLANNELPHGAAEEVVSALGTLVKDAAAFRDNADNLPVLLSVRSGAPISMPGMLRTILNIGISALYDSAEDTASTFYEVSYARFLANYGAAVYGIPRDAFEAGEQKFLKGGKALEILGRGALLAIIEHHGHVLATAGHTIPATTDTQVLESIQAIFRSWNSEEALEYRRREGIDDALGTAATIQLMVFGNFEMEQSGAGVAYSRSPIDGALEPAGDFIRGVQGINVVSGTVDTDNLFDPDQGLTGETATELREHLVTIERYLDRVAEVEFTVERGKLWLLQARPAQLSGQATIRYAVDMTTTDDRGRPKWSRRDALQYVTATKLTEATFPTFATDDRIPLGTGAAVSPGVTNGYVAFSVEQVDQLADEGLSPVLITEYTTTAQIRAIERSSAIVLFRRGMSSHSIVVARGWGKPVITAFPGRIKLVSSRNVLEVEGGSEAWLTFREPVAVDATTGAVYEGHLPIREPDEHSEYVNTILTWADAARGEGGPRLSVNADTAEELSRGLQGGAAGLGLARLEGLILARNRTAEFLALIDELVRRDLLNPTTPEAVAALSSVPGYKEFVTFLAHEYGQLFETGRTCPLAIRFLDDVPGVTGQRPSAVLQSIRGVRLFFVARALIEAQLEAIYAAARALVSGIPLRLQLLVPYCLSSKEFSRLKRRVLEFHAGSGGVAPVLPVPQVGVMLETPRSFLLITDYLEDADFISLGLNDLTELVMGLPHDSSVALQYTETGILSRNPLLSLDRVVAQMVSAAIDAVRREKRGTEVHVAADHVHDPDSVKTLVSLGVDTLSCRPERFEALRLMVAQALISAERDSEILRE